jgi:hypothetical protein
MCLSRRSATANDVYPYGTEKKEVSDQHAQACRFRGVRKRDYRIAWRPLNESEEALSEHLH